MQNPESRVVPTTVRDDQSATAIATGVDDSVQRASRAVDFALAHSDPSQPGTFGQDLQRTGRTSTISSSPDQRPAEVASMPLVPPSTPGTPSLHALQEWEGYVLEIGDGDFTARLVDLTAGATYEGEEADIPLCEVSAADAEKMQVGSIFRWVIGYERAAGPVRRVSQIVFRDLPAVSQGDLSASRTWADRVATAFGE